VRPTPTAGESTDSRTLRSRSSSPTCSSARRSPGSSSTRPRAVPVLPGPATTHLLAAGAAACWFSPSGFVCYRDCWSSRFGRLSSASYCSPASPALHCSPSTSAGIALSPRRRTSGDRVARIRGRRRCPRSTERPPPGRLASDPRCRGLCRAGRPAGTDVRACARLERVPATAFDAHYRLAIRGFVGLTIVGVTYHFYPPAVASTAGIGDRTARWSVTALLGGLGLEVIGSLASASPLVGAGRWLSVLGAVLYAAVLWTIFLERAK